MSALPESGSSSVSPGYYWYLPTVAAVAAFSSFACVLIMLLSYARGPDLASLCFGLLWSACLGQSYWARSIPELQRMMAGLDTFLITLSVRAIHRPVRFHT